MYPTGLQFWHISGTFRAIGKSAIAMWDSCIRTRRPDYGEYSGIMSMIVPYTLPVVTLMLLVAFASFCVSCFGIIAMGMPSWRRFVREDFFLATMLVALLLARIATCLRYILFASVYLRANTLCVEVETSGVLKHTKNISRVLLAIQIYVLLWMSDSVEALAPIVSVTFHLHFFMSVMEVFMELFLITAILVPMFPDIVRLAVEASHATTHEQTYNVYGPVDE